MNCPQWCKEVVGGGAKLNAKKIQLKDLENLRLSFILYQSLERKPLYQNR